MKINKITGVLFTLLLLSALRVSGQDMQRSTYCNPVNLDYTYMVYNANKHISYRSGADPAVVRFRNEYYLFVTRSMGYWHSTDLSHWDFITPEKWYFQGSNAPAASNYKDSLLYVAGDPSGSMSILYTNDPKKGNWKATPSIINNLQDPDLFIDDNGKAYMYWGSSNKFPIRMKTLERNRRFEPSEHTDTLFNLDPAKHGWERFGENNEDTIPGYIEGPWMTKYKGTYYLQYAAPGTEFNVYGDGVYTGKSPKGPFHYAPNNPVSFKPGGFITGAGHGSTVRGPMDHYWHFTTMAVNVNIGWERRIGMFPTYFDQDGWMYCNTYFGDYPHYAPNIPQKAGAFTGWMLLSYKKPVKVSSMRDSFPPENLNDENIKTFWVAKENNEKQWIRIDLEQPDTVHAIQVNYNDYHTDLYGRIAGLHYRYIIEGSLDGKEWISLVDRSKNFKDVPNDYVELAVPQVVRYIKFINRYTPTPFLSLSDLRIFGKGNGMAPEKVKGLVIDRMTDRRNASLHWAKSPNAQGYNILWGVAPDKLYSSWLVYDNNELTLRCLNTDQTYYFSIEAFNENGVSSRTKVVKIE